MKKILFVSLVFLVFSIPIANAVTQTISELPISLKIQKIQRAPLATSDLIVLDFTVTNNGNNPFTLSSSGLALADSKERVFESVTSFALSNQDETSIFDVSCEFFLYETIQPGLTHTVRDLCFQVPQERNLEYGLILAETSYEYCGSSNQFLKTECNGYSLGKIALTTTEVEKVTSSESGGCLIATAAYGTELAPEVQNLREIRNKMYETELGGGLMKTVNDFYYSFSPTVADWERENSIFRETVKLFITPSIVSFTILDYNTIDSEEGLIGYIASLILLNVGMYFVLPAIIIMKIKYRFGRT